MHSIDSVVDQMSRFEHGTQKWEAGLSGLSRLNVQMKKQSTEEGGR